ncbi:hypothetical protein I5M27_10635 [Adhaeribacter sp. BT258]|uniref:Uncharacterized protein n=1 Tax=Adhaeribacter terrigena TaxID=2793070 RepID=A0ABS1C491_9BACT|nr:hypothetical protein [Adhaeribacter terrigena]MBK0403443.1 hypothetical protein [Adhaeribacter terrigena]
MKKIFVLIIGLLVGFELQASCMAEWMAIYPSTNSVTQNPVFLLEYDESEYKLATKWDELEFTLLVNNKHKVGVKVLQKVTGVGANSQLLLQPEKLLTLNDSVQLEVDFKKKNTGILNQTFLTFRDRIKWRKWKVAQPEDLKPVSWVGNLSWEYPEERISSISTRGVNFLYQLHDDNPVHYEYVPGKTTALNLFEIEINGRKFYSLGGGPKSKFSIYDSICGGNFYLQHNKQYEARITALDFSGNRSQETKLVAFNTFRN